jgi:hypothetical protein
LHGSNSGKEKILDQLESLKNLPRVKEVKALKKRLELELQKLEEKIKHDKVIPEFTEIAKEQREINANVRRSSSLHLFPKTCHMFKTRQDI